jgi:hypothetical protein
VYVDGGDVIRQFLDAGLINEATITVIPIDIGEGVPLFTDDAEFDAGSLGKPQGPQAIRAMIQSSLQALDATQHALAKSLITFTDPDTAEVRTYLISQHILGEKHYFIGAEYADRLVRTPQGWKIAYRRLDRMWKEGDRSVITRSH